jgi:hypothetical protein
VSDRPDHQLWKVPEPLGYPEAIQAVGGVAAPLLAGFSLSPSRHAGR